MNKFIINNVCRDLFKARLLKYRIVCVLQVKQIAPSASGSCEHSLAALGTAAVQVQLRFVCAFRHSSTGIV